MLIPPASSEFRSLVFFKHSQTRCLLGIVSSFYSFLDPVSSSIYVPCGRYETFGSYSSFFVSDRLHENVKNTYFLSIEKV